MVAESSTPTNEDMTDVMWSDPQWLASFPLNKSTAFHYFTMSQFYDLKCNNQIINMQQMDSKLLKTMKGIEYSHDSPCPGLYTITKSYRHSPQKVETLAIYYIHEGRIFQAPTIHSVMSARLLQSFHHLRKSFENVRMAAQLSGDGQYVWQQKQQNEEEKDNDNKKDNKQQKHQQQHQQQQQRSTLGNDGVSGVEDEETFQLSSGEHKAMDVVLYDIWHKNAAINEQQLEKQQILQQQQPQQPQQQEQPQQQNLSAPGMLPGAGPLRGQPGPA